MKNLRRLFPHYCRDVYKDTSRIIDYPPLTKKILNICQKGLKNFLCTPSQNKALQYNEFYYLMVVAEQIAKQAKTTLQTTRK